MNIEDVGSAEQFIQRLLQERKVLDGAVVFLQVYKDMMVERDVLERDISVLKEERDSIKVKFDDEISKYERRLVDVKDNVKKESEECDRLIEKMKSEYQIRKVEHDSFMVSIKNSEDDKIKEYEDMCKVMDEDLSEKREMLRLLQEDYDGIMSAVSRIKGV